MLTLANSPVRRSRRTDKCTRTLFLTTCASNDTRYKARFAMNKNDAHLVDRDSDHARTGVCKCG
jgi:hypothetical protein